MTLKLFIIIIIINNIIIVFVKYSSVIEHRHFKLIQRYTVVAINKVNIRFEEINWVFVSFMHNRDHSQRFLDISIYPLILNN